VDPLLDWIGFDDWNLTGVDSLATDPVDPSRLYVLAAPYTNAWTTQNGAVLRSTDRGATFARTNLPFKSGGNMPGPQHGRAARHRPEPQRDALPRRTQRQRPLALDGLRRLLGARHELPRRSAPTCRTRTTPTAT
jgi:hypothetical protein